MMNLSKNVAAMLRLCFLAALVETQDSPDPTENFFTLAQTTVVTSTSSCYSLPVQTATARKISYAESIESDLHSSVDFYFHDSGHPAKLFGLQDPNTGLYLLFDTSSETQMGISYPDQSAVIVDASGITVVSGDCSTVASILIPDFLSHMVASVVPVNTKKSRRGAHLMEKSLGKRVFDEMFFCHFRDSKPVRPVPGR